MTAGAKGEPKAEPRNVNLHAIALDVRAFIVPIAELRSSIDKIESRWDPKTGLVVGLDLTCETAEGPRQFAIVLGPAVSPFEIAGELEGVGKTIVEKIALDVGLDAQEAARHARDIARRDRIEARRQTVDHAGANVTCDYCRRSVSVIVDGVRLCNRHAEELGVRPHGKIGEGT